MSLPETKFRGARFAVFEADLELHELRKHGLRIKLTGQPFQALALLLERSGEVVTRDDLRRALWPNEPWGDHDQRVNKIINKIREALCDSADAPRYLETIPRLGYRFLVQVEMFGEVAGNSLVKLETIELQPATQPSVHVAGTLAAPPAVVAVPASRLRWWMLGATLALAAIALLISNRVFLKPPQSVRILEPSPLTTFVGSELYPSLSPDGKQVVFGWDGGSRIGFHLYTAAVSGGGAHKITDDPRSDSDPAWSPTGNQIAFLRDAGPGHAEIWLVQSDGTGARKIREIRNATTDQALTWTKDPNWLIVAQRAPGNGPPALFLVSTRNGEERQMTSSSGQSAGDLSPCVSPDGQRLAFTRATSASWRDIFVVSLSNDQRFSGEPLRLTDSHTIIGAIAWTSDSRSLVLSAATTAAGSRHLFRVDTASAKNSGISELGIEGDHPTIAGAAFKLAFVHKNIEQSSIWKLELDNAAATPRQSRMVSSTRRDFTTDLSPDGKSIVFSSVRSGPSEIWMSDTDGYNLRRLTSIGGSTPRWSPDGKQIAFESNQRGQPDIYVLTLATGSVRRFTTDGASNLRPSWSRDGRYIYFGSNRTGKSQIWKVPGNGGDAVQITRKGGLYAVETFDRKSIYYTSPDMPSAVWRTTVNGGDEAAVIQNVSGYSTIAMAPDGLYYLSGMTATGAQLDFYRLADGAIRPLASIDRPVHRFLSSSANGRAVVYTKIDREDSDVMLVDPFR